MIRTNLYLKIILFLLIILLPFSISDYRDNVTPEKISSDLRFYEINTCSISLGEFLVHNPKKPFIDSLILKEAKNITNIKVYHQERFEGKSNYDVRKLFILWFDMIENYHFYPLRFGSVSYTHQTLPTTPYV